MMKEPAKDKPEGTEESVAKFRRTYLLVGIGELLMAAAFGVILVLVFKSPVGYKSNEFLAHWAIVLVLCAFTIGAIWMGSSSVFRALSQPKRGTPQQLALWFHRRLVPRLGSSGQFGPPWPILFSVFDYTGCGDVEAFQVKYQEWWTSFASSTGFNVLGDLVKGREKYDIHYLIEQIAPTEETARSGSVALLVSVSATTPNESTEPRRYRFDVQVRKTDSGWLLAPECPTYQAVHLPPAQLASLVSGGRKK